MTNEHQWIGRSLRRVEDLRLLTGRGRYVDDIPLDHDGLHAAFLRSPHAHARIRGIDTRQAGTTDGVVAVYTAPDLGPLNRPLPLVIPRGTGAEKTPWPLASETVHFVGEPVAVVLAQSRYQAEDALDRIWVDYEPLPAVVDVVAAAEPDAPRVHLDLPDNVIGHLHQVVGDPDAAFAQAEHTLTMDLTIHRGSTQPMEPRGLVVWPEGDQLTVWASTQRPHRLADILAEILELDRTRIYVIAPDIGGGFGPKGSLYPEDIVVAWLAYHHGCPVKWIEDRREHFLMTLQERDQVHHLQVAFTGEGRVLALRDRFVHEAGAYAPYGLGAAHNTVIHMPGPYQIAHMEIEGRTIYTNAVPVGPNRGAGRPQGSFVMERVMDAVARALDLDPGEVRRRNFIQPDQMPYETGIMAGGQPVCYDSGDYPGAFQMALDAIDVARVRREQAEARQQGRYLGLGVTAYTESTSGGAFEGARVRLDDTGRVRVYTGATPQGQGHETTFAQVCAEVLGVHPDQIDVVAGDTRWIERGIGTFGSRSATLAGSAVEMAGQIVRQRILEVAGAELEAAPEDLEITPEGVHVRGVPQTGLTFGEIAQAAREQGVDLDATQYFEPPSAAWANGALALVVEVNPETGVVRVLRGAFVHDCGHMINPQLVEGQIIGGFAQALGGTLLEKIAYDANGQPLTASFMDYLLPTAVDIPPIEVLHMVSPSPLNPLGTKGVGEGGVMPVAGAIAQAVEDALAPWGVTVDRVPLFPEDVWRLLSKGV